MSQGSNSSALRHFNERVVISTLRKKVSASKPELAKAVGLTLQTLTRIVDDLEARGLVERTGRRTQGVGQPSPIYQINADSLYSVGVHVGREGVQCILANFAGAVLQKSAATYRHIEPRALVELIARETTQLVAQLNDEQRKKFAGVGLAMPWFLGSWTDNNEMDEDYAKLWLDFDLAAHLEGQLSYPIFYENDCTAAAAAELYFGKNEGARNLLYIYVGSFVGGGLVLNGDLERGVFSNAACLATMPVPESSLASKPDTQGWTSFVDRASINSLLRHLQFYGAHIQHIAQLPEVMDEHRVLIHDWMLDCADSIVFVIHSSIGLLDLEKIIIDSDLPHYLLSELVDMIKRKLDKTARRNLFIPELQQGTLGLDAMAIGGAILPLYAHFAPDKTVILKGGVPDRKHLN